ncbi:alpha/beta hydrolase-fold protein [Mobilicoccus sp.]|uniref:alpha/beta hydrolase n=1 Tax=Mobilicoccus sp. TaxID=2034349 RepID=UPI0028A79490|nr:alpha/beta hydrolase-fold protein [Mobilicoccus sp.]
MLSITSSGFVILVRVALFVAFVWIVVRWNAAGRNTVLGVLRRVVGLLVVMVLAVLNVLVPINAQYGWYGSWSDVWSDLVGQEVVPAQATRGAAAAQAARTPTGPSPLAALSTSGRGHLPLQLTKTSYGGYQTISVPGRSSGVTGQVTVWFPPAYDQQPAAQFPVIEISHGYLPAPLATFTVFHMDAVLHRLHERGRIALPLLVIPHWAPDRLDTECVDGGRPGDPAIETWMTTDVPAWVYENFRVGSNRESWASMGYSAGGWCALMSTMLHPHTYSAAISLGGYAYPALDPPYIPFTPDSPAGRRYDLVALARSAPPAVALWTLTSTVDKLSGRTSQALAAAARPPMSLTPTVLSSGAHRAEVWEPYIAPSLEWLGRTSPGFAV